MRFEVSTAVGMMETLRWRKCVSLKCWRLPTSLHGTKAQKTIIFECCLKQIVSFWRLNLLRVNSIHLQRFQKYRNNLTLKLDLHCKLRSTKPISVPQVNILNTRPSLINLNTTITFRLPAETACITAKSSKISLIRVEYRCFIEMLKIMFLYTHTLYGKAGWNSSEVLPEELPKLFFFQMRFRAVDFVLHITP